MTQVARLKPYNERKGYRTRVYMIDGARFLIERGWYEVTDALADKLRDLHQEHYDPDSPDLFDVCTQDEAEKLDEKARTAEADSRASARSPAQARPRTRPGAVTGSGGGGGGFGGAAGGGPGTGAIASANLGGSGTDGPGGTTGDTSTADLPGRSGTAGKDSDKDPDEDEDEGRLTELGRVGDGPKPRRSTGPTPSTHPTKK